MPGTRGLSAKTEHESEPSAAAERGFAPRIGRFSVLRKLGEGGMGVVLVAYDETLDRKLAIKLVKRQSARPRRARMAREAQALARLSHPNVVQIYEVGEHEGELYLAMEFVAGQTLGEWLAERSRPWPEIVGVFRRAGSGLAAAHEAGLVHRDFKPANVVVQADGSVKVLDFGLVREHVESTSEDQSKEDEPEPASSPGLNLAGLDTDPLQMDLTRTNSLLGTPAYMAPEQLRGLEVDARSDQFAFCVALWEALYGERPFRADHIADQVIAMLGHEIREPPRAAKVPKWLRRVLERGLQPKPEARWPSMPALLDALAADPRSRRLGVFATLALVLALAGGYAYHRVDQANRRAACTTESEAIETRWTPALRDQAAAAFAASELGFAPEAWAYVERELNAYVGEWKHARDEACVGGELDDALSPELLALTRECFDERSAELAVLVDDLTHADAQTIEQAVTRVSLLADLDECVDSRYLHAQLRPPAELADEVRALSSEVRAAGTPAELDALEGRIRATEWLPLVAELELARGRQQRDAGEYQDARASLERALVDALRGGDDEGAAISASELVAVLGVDLDLHDEALRTAQIAQALADRARPGDQVSLLHAKLLHGVGIVHRRRKDYERALEHYEQALSVVEARLGAEHPQTAEILGDMGVAHRRLGDEDTALSYYERSVAILEACYGPLHPKVAVELTNMGAIYRRRGDFDQALLRYVRARQIFEQRGLDHPRVADVLSHIAMVRLAQERFDEALELRLRIVEIRTKAYGPDDRRTADTHLNISQAANPSARAPSLSSTPARPLGSTDSSANACACSRPGPTSSQRCVGSGATTRPSRSPRQSSPGPTSTPSNPRTWPICVRS